jgi:hypothetical protein
VKVQNSVVTVTSRYPYVSRTLIRPRKNTSAAGAFKVYVDKRLVGVVPAMETRSYSVTAGTHVLRVRFRWFMSRSLKFDVPAGESIAVATTIQHTGRSFLRLIFRPFTAVELFRETPG